MKGSHVAIGLGLAVAVYFGYRALSKGSAQRRVDDYAANYGSGNEAPVQAMVWNGVAWVPAGAPVPAPPASALGPAGMTLAAWAALNASTAKVPPLGTVGLLSSELAALQTFNPPA